MLQDFEYATDLSKTASAVRLENQQNNKSGEKKRHQMIPAINNNHIPRFKLTDCKDVSTVEILFTLKCDTQQ